MAIVVYKCDVCKREIEKERNINGLENIQRCTITHGCRGKLYQTQVLADFVRGSLPDAVAGLDDWRQRKVLYNHEQTIERDEWVIEHNLGTFPSVSVFINLPTEDDPDNTVEIIPEDTVIVDEDTLLLRFSRAWSGLVQLVARQSDPDLLRPFIGVSADTTTNQQISVTNENVIEVTVATRVSTVNENPTILLGIEYTTVENAIMTKDYITYTDITQDIGVDQSVSPWQGSDKVIIKGKIYTIRSFNAFVSEMQDETIGSGSYFRFVSIDDGSGTRSIEQDEVYLIFAKEPYAKVDKLNNKYIDVFDVDLTNNQFSFIFDSNKLFAEDVIIQEIYPPIRSIKI